MSVSSNVQNTKSQIQIITTTEEHVVPKTTTEASEIQLTPPQMDGYSFEVLSISSSRNRSNFFLSSLNGTTAFIVNSSSSEQNTTLTISWIGVLNK